MEKRPPLSYFWIVFIGACIAAAVLILTHPKNGIISFDEGFHGGAALYGIQEINYLLHGKHGMSPHYIEAEFSNGVILYPPTWTIMAMITGTLFSPSINSFRLATSVFYVVSIVFVYWFVRKSTNKEAPAIAAAVIFGTVPMVMIYSHLMMLEVPLMLGITAMVGCAYLLGMNLLPRNFKTWLILTLVFGAAVLTKLPALPVAWAIIIVYMLASSILFYKSKFYQFWLKWEFIWLLLVSFASLEGFVKLEERFLHGNMIQFFLDQSQNGDHTNPVVHALQMAWNNRDFYLRDFKHIPVISLVWVGSVIIYALWKRTSFGLLLAVWTIVTYAGFSAVFPQVPQYIITIYVPLALGPALLFTSLGELVQLKWQSLLIGGLTVALAGAQIAALPLSEGYGWRENVTSQQAGAAYINDHSSYGTRVISWHSGTSLAVRLAALNKNVQIIDGSTQVCPQAMVDDFDWALVIDQPPVISDLDHQILSQTPWQAVPNVAPATSGQLYQNTGATVPLVIHASEFSTAHTITDSAASNGHALQIQDTDSQPDFWGCIRYLPYGKQTITFRLKTLELSPTLPDSQNILDIQYAGSQGSEFADRVLTAGDLRKAQNSYTDFSFTVDHEQVNHPGEFKANLYAGKAKIAIDTVTVTPQK